MHILSSLSNLKLAGYVEDIQKEHSFPNRPQLKMGSFLVSQLNDILA